jgi:hypothetical protein
VVLNDDGPDGDASTMIEINIDPQDLMKWSRYLNMVRKATPKALANSLNSVGESIIRNYAHFVSLKTDIDEETVMANLVITEAAPGSLEWKMDCSALFPPSGDWDRPWDVRETDKSFSPDLLVKVLTSPDSDVCDKCKQIAENSPYTWDEIIAMLYEGGQWGLFHPNCKCVTQNWQSTRALPIKFGQDGTAPPELFTMRQLGQRVADEMEVLIRVTKPD